MSDSARKVAITVRSTQKKAEEHRVHHSTHQHEHHPVAPAEHHPTHPAVAHTAHAHPEKQEKEREKVKEKETPAVHRKKRTLSTMLSGVFERSSAPASPVPEVAVTPEVTPTTDPIPTETPLPVVPPTEPRVSSPLAPEEPALPTPPPAETLPVEPITQPPMVTPPPPVPVKEELPAPVLPPKVEPTQRSFVIPKKPVVLDGLNMSALAVAYFCMEIALEKDMPTYSGGLGVLAGDMVKSAADLRVPMIAVTLLYRKGFFRQRIDDSGWQNEEEERWEPSSFLRPLPHEVTITLEGRTVRIRAWLYKVTGIGGNEAPVIFLDTDVPGNSDEDLRITDRLYGSDARGRLLQEAVLGIGGVRMLEAIGATRILRYHMNEGHAALLTLELYHRFAATEDPIEEVRSRAVFTTHTPIAAGHDRFAQGMANEILGRDYIPPEINNAVFENGMLNMTRLGFYFSSHINGVAKRHGEVTRELFPGYRIESITNGVYARAWTSPSFARLFDRYLPGWQGDPHSLRYALSVPLEEIWRAHEEAKRILIENLNDRYHAGLRQEYFTIGFARRATGYKRAKMLFSDKERLLRLAKGSKGIQIIYSGKAHPADEEGKRIMQEVIRSMKEVGADIPCVYIENYNTEVAKLLVSGVDLWLNTPLRPQEASGTSGMKAALNGIPQLSTLDGWWLEGHIEGVTGWSIGRHPEHGLYDHAEASDAEDLYRKLEEVVLPCFERDRREWTRIMRQAIAINGSFFNTHRMVEQYVLGAYFI